MAAKAADRRRPAAMAALPGEALRADQVIGMPSRAVDEAWHGLILCTARYAAFCDEAYGRFLHHHPEGDGSGGGGSWPTSSPVPWWRGTASDSPAETIVLWDLDDAVSVREPWGIPAGRVAQVESHVARS